MTEVREVLRCSHRYGNNCICGESHATEKFYEGDVAAMHEFGFDSIKLDGCGAQLDMELWYETMQKTGKAYVVENCHW
jgi:alpha-galactosidase